MRTDIKPRVINGKTYTTRTKAQFEIVHNGITYRLSETSLSPAMKKAHAFVRKFVAREWQRLHIPNDTTAQVMVDGQLLCSVMGQFKNRSINSFTLG
ncbi:MAG: hypothetical protein K6D37_05875 [Prevotella sp.]|nr:hypothetical protein [Prevotella sp.]